MYCSGCRPIDRLITGFRSSTGCRSSPSLLHLCKDVVTSGQYSLDRRAVMIVLPQLSAEAAVERFEQRIQTLPRNVASPRVRSSNSWACQHTLAAGQRVSRDPGHPRPDGRVLHRPPRPGAPLAEAADRSSRIPAAPPCPTPQQVLDEEPSRRQERQGP